MIHFSPSQLLASLSAAWGIGVIAGGEDRFKAPQLDAMADIAPWWVWGTVFLTYAIVLAVGNEQRNIRWLIVLAGGVPYFFLLMSYWPGTLSNTYSPFVGVSVWSTVWLFHVGVGTQMGWDQFRTTKAYERLFNRE